jgi:hypothetical protein
MISLYLSFADPRTGRSVVYLRRDRVSHRVFAVLTRLLDWTHRFRVAWVSGYEAVVVSTPHRGIFREADAVLHVVASLPLTFVPGLVLETLWSGFTRIRRR